MAKKPTNRRHDPSKKSIARWINEGGAPKGIDRSMHKRPRDPNQLAKSIIGIATGEIADRAPTPEEQGKDPAAVALGRKGGQARAKNISATKRKAIAQKAAKTRWRE